MSYWLPPPNTPYRRRYKYLPRYIIGTEKRVSTGFSVAGTVLQAARKKLIKGQSLSAIVEALLQGWVDGTYVIQGAQPGAEVTP